MWCVLSDWYSCTQTATRNDQSVYGRILPNMMDFGGSNIMLGSELFEISLRMVRCFTFKATLRLGIVSFSTSSSYRTSSLTLNHVLLCMKDFSFTLCCSVGFLCRMLITKRMFCDEQLIRRVQMRFDTHQLYLRTEKAHNSTPIPLERCISRSRASQC